MNDFDYDVMQKKRVAYSAKNRVCGSKSKYCSLPSDHLTQAQINRKSGPVMSFNLNAPMSYSEFKRMPRDLQQQYVNGIQSRFCVGVHQIEMTLFHVSNNTLWSHARRNGLTLGRGKRLSASEQQVWERWLEGPQHATAHAEEPVLEEPSEKPVKKAVEDAGEDTLVLAQKAAKQPFEVSDLTTTFVGEFDPEKFVKWVSMLPIPDCKVKIRLEVTSDV